MCSIYHSIYVVYTKYISKKVLVADSGGRGHAIAWQFKQDPNVKEVICCPGNTGIAREKSILKVCDTAKT